MSILKKLSILFFTLFFASCTLNKIDNVHGVSNLKNKIKLIKINETNKNDITKMLGPVPIENKEEKRWTYFEVRETKTKYGKRDIYVNDYVEIFFNNYGITNKIEIRIMNDLLYDELDQISLGNWTLGSKIQLIKTDQYAISLLPSIQFDGFSGEFNLKQEE